MPTRRIPETIEPDEGLTAETAVQVMRNTAPIEDPDTPTDDEFAMLDRMRNLLDENADTKVHLKLYRLADGPRKKFGWCADYSPDDYQQGGLAMIRNEWGPGEYQLRLMSSRGLAKVLPILIEPDSTKPRENPAPQPAQNSELGQVLTMLAQGQQRILEALSDKPNPMDQMTQMIALAGAMRQAFAPAAPASPASDPMAMVTQVFGMVREAKSAVKELVDDDRPGPDPSDPMSMVGQLLPMITQAIGNQQQPQQQPQPIYPMQPLQVPASVDRASQVQANNEHEMPAPVAANPIQQPEPETVENLILRGLIEDLIQLAIDGKPPADGGAFIYEKLPDELIDFMGQRYWFEMIAIRFPIIKPHEKWLREAKTAADALFANPPPDDDEQQAGG